MEDVEQMRAKLEEAEKTAETIKGWLADSLPEGLSVPSMGFEALPDCVEVLIDGEESHVRWKHEQARAVRDWLIRAYPLKDAKPPTHAVLWSGGGVMFLGSEAECKARAEAHTGLATVTMQPLDKVTAMRPWTPVQKMLPATNQRVRVYTSENMDVIAKRDKDGI